MAAYANNGDSNYASDDELRATQESKRRRRRTITETIRQAGINPAEINVKLALTGDEQARLLQTLTEQNEARIVAEKSGRKELRNRLKQTVEKVNGFHPENGTNGATSADSKTGTGNMNGTYRSSSDNHSKERAQG